MKTDRLLSQSFPLWIPIPPISIISFHFFPFLHPGFASRMVTSKAPSVRMAVLSRAWRCPATRSQVTPFSWNRVEKLGKPGENGDLLLEALPNLGDFNGSAKIGRNNQLGYQTYKKNQALSNETKLEKFANRLDQANLIHIGDFNCLVVLSKGLKGYLTWKEETYGMFKKNIS